MEARPGGKPPGQDYCREQEPALFNRLLIRLLRLLIHIKHLASRFVGVLANQPLSPAEQDQVNEALKKAESSLFWAQDPIDQRHAFDVALRVRVQLGADRGAFAAALLHDVGKRHCHIGPLGRSFATVFDALRLPMSEGWRNYRNHGPLGAADLVAIGASSLSIAFAKGEIEPEIDPEVWNVLVAADDA